MEWIEIIIIYLIFQCSTGDWIHLLFVNNIQSIMKKYSERKII